MSKTFRTITSLAIVLVALAGCSSKTTVSCITKLDDYIYEIEEYKSLDYENARKYFAENYDNWGGGCSAVSTIIDGKRVIGRNMDLNISNKCAYVVRTDLTESEPGTYKTFGLMYTFRDISPDYSFVKEHGITNEFYDIAPFMCDDVMNTEGFHIEINMRNAECWPNGDDMFAVDHTNKNAKERIYMFEIPQYLGLHCKTVEEAKEYLKNLDVYSKKGYWNYCFVVSDATGASELLEFCLDSQSYIGNVFWIKNEDLAPELALPTGVIAQTNFYINYYAYLLQDIKSGRGRYATIQQDIGFVTTKEELYALMKKIQYSSFYLPYDECKANHFDPRSENIGTVWGATSVLIMEDALEPYYKEGIDAYTAPIRAMSREEKQNKNEYWESTFTEIVEPTEKTIQVRFFEQGEESSSPKLFKISFNGTEKIAAIK